MGLRLVDEDENLVHIIDEEARIFYRRLPNRRRGEIMARNTKRGEVNYTKASIEMLEWSITGWQGFYVIEDGRRKDIPYARDKVALIPDTEQADLVEKIGANADEGGEEAGNSGPTSDSSTTTKGTPVPSVGVKP